MSYSDVNYLAMPSFWTEFFKDKPLIDKLYETSLDVISDSYRDIVESSANTSLFNHRLIDKVSWLPIRINLSSVITKEIGDDYYELLPIDSTVVNFSYICSKPSIDRAKVVINKEDICLLRSDELRAYLSKEDIDTKLFRGQAALLAKNCFVLSKTEFSDSIERNIEQNSVVTIRTTKLFKTTSEFQDLEQNNKCLLKISMLSETYSVPIVEYSEQNGFLLLTIDRRISLPTSGDCLILSSDGTRIRSTALAITYRDSRLVLWANNCYVDYSTYQNKFASELISNVVTNSERMASYNKSLRKLALTEYSPNNLKSAIATTYGSLLISVGEENNEDILSVDLGSGRIITNQDVYDHIYPFSINKDILVRANTVLFNTFRMPGNMYVISCNFSQSGMFIQNNIDNLFSDRDITSISSYTNPVYSRVLSINSVDCDLLKIGANYLVVTCPSTIPTSGNSLRVVDRESGLLLYSTPSHITIEITKISDGIKKLTQTTFETPTLSTVEVGTFSNNSQLANGMYIPYKLYKTTPTRRIISEIEYDGKVGYLPIHVIGDYGIYVGDNLKFKSSAYYLFNDILKHNMYYVAYSESHLNLGLNPIAIDNIDSVFGPVGGVPIHLEYISSVSILDINVTDQYSNSVTKELSDTLSTAEAPQEYSVGSGNMHSRYLQFIMPANITDFSSVTSITYDSVEYSFSIKNSQGNIIEVLLNQELPGTDVSKCFILGINPDSIINVESVGGSNKLLGSWEPLVGSSRPIATLPILLANNSQGILSIGPRITVS
jgi:hypothetical protein